jgi:hypothetical protein
MWPMRQLANHRTRVTPRVLHIHHSSWGACCPPYRLAYPLAPLPHPFMPASTTWPLAVRKPPDSPPGFLDASSSVTAYPASARCLAAPNPGGAGGRQGRGKRQVYVWEQAIACQVRGVTNIIRSEQECRP